MASEVVAWPEKSRILQLGYCALIWIAKSTPECPASQHPIRPGWGDTERAAASASKIGSSNLSARTPRNQHLNVPSNSGAEPLAFALSRYHRKGIDCETIRRPVWMQRIAALVICHSGSPSGQTNSQLPANVVDFEWCFLLPDILWISGAFWIAGNCPRPARRNRYRGTVVRCSTWACSTRHVISATANTPIRFPATP
jgi:hypothetical protein